VSILDSFFVALGFTVDDTGAEKYEQSMKGLRNSVLTAIGVFTAASAAVGAFALTAAKSMADVNAFAEVNDVSASMVDRLGKIAIEADGSL